MKGFLKSFLAGLLALIVFFGILFFASIGVVGALATQEQVALEPKSVLVIDLSRPMNDKKLEDPFADLSGEEIYPDLSTALALIEHASRDSSVKGIYLVAADNVNGFAASSELKEALKQFKATGKFIYAYGDYISQRAYALASLANKIYCHPKGIFEWQGMSVELVFFKRMLDKLEIKPQIFYAGKFKSATEPFRETEMTEANRVQTTEWLNDIYNQFLEQVASDRKLNVDSLKAWADRYAFDRPEKAVGAKLLDGLRYDDEVKSEIRKQIGIASTDKINFITLPNYSKAVTLDNPYAKQKIAVVVAEGDIIYGKGMPESIGSEEYLSVLRKIRNDDDIKAVVLRINSPGGSSLASEIMWRELELMRKQGKRLVVSMGNVAASGGYYIACNADRILVQPNTITGSIGVFSIVPDLSSFMNNKLGISFDRVSTSRYADAPSVTRPLRDEEKRIVQGEVDRIYMDFKQRVADGRKKDINYIDSIAQGRVWTGKKAIEIGLADEVGGLSKAIEVASKLAKLKEYRIKMYPEPKSILDYVLQTYPTEFSRSQMKRELGEEEYMILGQYKKLKEMAGDIRTELPFQFNYKK